MLVFSGQSWWWTRRKVQDLHGHIREGRDRNIWLVLFLARWHSEQMGFHLFFRQRAWRSINGCHTGRPTPCEFNPFINNRCLPCDVMSALWLLDLTFILSFSLALHSACVFHLKFLVLLASVFIFPPLPWSPGWLWILPECVIPDLFLLLCVTKSDIQVKACTVMSDCLSPSWGPTW